MKLKGKFKVFYLEYPTRSNNSYGAGGWSRNAQRPRPAVKCIPLNGSKITFSGKSVILDTNEGRIRKLKCTIIRANNPKERVREDYPLEDLACILA